jgi:leader peptidase (prepilin peptidase)/N-methyltransferase
MEAVVWGELSAFHILVATVVGLCVGSFLNVVIYRLPIMMERQWRHQALEILEQQDKTDAAAQRFDLAFPRSSCPSCKQHIKPWHNIPVLSYLLLRGRCANCAASISIRYPLVEAGTAVLGLVCLYQFGPTELGAMAVIFTWCLLVLALIDADTQLLPDSIVYPLLWLGLAINSLGAFTDLGSAVWGAVAGYLCLWSVYWLFKLATGKDGMGHGDFKLLAALGAWLGWQALPIVILLSAGCGAILGGLQILVGGRDRHQPMPFGPYLAAAGWIVLLWREPLTAAYLQLLGQF